MSRTATLKLKKQSADKQSMRITLKYKAILWVMEALLRIPTSYQGFVWYQTKRAKQLSNCVADMCEADYISEQAIKAAQAEPERCREEVDRKNGTVEFIKEEA
ncbi:TPA: hypothetical protein ACKP4S_000364 [Stenotrophomonas maltophilia]|jgi:membrane carboxypeptidase/penicillin-binding protein|uniref:hypothetical protein n=1 Tax=Stenotrophomonas sp. SMYL86 TaxID=3076044 RepID=UPI001310DC30|nr:hypothetical protein [Stenotrophomonas sp. SMYL86]